MRRRILQNGLIVISLVIGLGVLSVGTRNVQALGPTATPTGAAEAPMKPLAWPVKPPTPEQLSEARACDMETLAEKRYPKTLGIDALKDAYKLETLCDKAVLMAGYAARLEENQPLPAAAKVVFMETVSANVAFAYRLPIWGTYIAKMDIVEAPPIAKQPITRVEIQHKWTGLGDAVQYSLTIKDADTDRPVVTGTVHKGLDLSEPTTPTSTPTAMGTIDKALVQALGPALTDLLPSGALVSQTPCWDNYPDWTVTLTFKDGTELEVVTKGSNFFFGGGPWQTTIGKQTYVQYSAAFLVKIYDIVKALNLPRGETAAMGCGGMGEPLSDFFPSPAVG